MGGASAPLFSEKAVNIISIIIYIILGAEYFSPPSPPPSPNATLHL